MAVTNPRGCPAGEAFCRGRANPAPDPEAYRRDRRKDALLQSHGWLVLRFLADDLGKRLDEVLDAVLRAVVGRGRGE
ncbi:MAG: DUF559 domain-containing protein [Verrucomicrobiaceae bacterium]|nr:DUF559 domain-containing protein [Verrucomicrobiaceae bacterium]